MEPLRESHRLRGLTRSKAKALILVVGLDYHRGRAEMTMRRFNVAARSAALAASLCPLTALAADLPLDPVGGRFNGEPASASRSSMAMQWQTYPQPRRFDIYGNPLGGFFVVMPDPLVINNACPKAIEPTYDIDGNFAGYAPFVACR